MEVVCKVGGRVMVGLFQTVCLLSFLERVLENLSLSTNQGHLRDELW